MKALKQFLSRPNGVVRRISFKKGCRLNKTSASTVITDQKVSVHFHPGKHLITSYAPCQQQYHNSSATQNRIKNSDTSQSHPEPSPIFSFLIIRYRSQPGVLQIITVCIPYKERTIVSILKSFARAKEKRS
jgi:hypothetical protein